MLKYLTAAAAITAGLAAGTPAAAQNPDFCYGYANAMIASNYRGMQRQCPQFKNANMDWDAHFGWCGSQPQQRVKQVEEEQSAKLDGCLTSGPAAVPPPRISQAAPPRGPVVAPGALPPAPGQSFYAKAEGADEPILCIDISGGAIREGTPIMLWKCHQQAPQRFGLNPTRGIVFVTANRNLCVDGADKQQLRLVRCEQGSTAWRYDPRTNTIRSANGLCWDIAAGNVPANIHQRQPIIAWRCHNGINQQFVLNN